MRRLLKWIANYREQRRRDRALIAIVEAMKAEHEAVCQSIAWQIIASGRAKEFLAKYDERSEQS